MDKETFDKVISLNEQMENLNSVNYELDKYSSSFLSFGYRYSTGEKSLYSDYDMRPIENLLKKHYEMIRQEINDEIQSIQKQIDEL
jgi:hypothetical protein